MSEKHSHKLFPWWAGYWLINPFRRFFQNPGIFKKYIKEGMTVLEIGSGMGFFTLPFAGMVGPAGKIIAADVQEKMLSALKKRAASRGLSERVETHLTPKDTIAADYLNEKVDIVFAAFVVHEMPDTKKAFCEFYSTLKKGGLCIFAEPAGVVPEKEFEESVELARGCGFTVKENLTGFGSTRGRILVR
jgi:ubiquinone/menaquinone biosynthesis C-methylase UbiE